MKAVQLTLDEETIAEVDRVARRLHTTRSAFTREALRAALRAQAEREDEARHRRGYVRQPAQVGEVEAWSGEQAWGDGWDET